MNSSVNQQQYEYFQEKRKIIESLIEKQLVLFSSLNMTGWKDTLHSLQERVLADNFKVLVLGEFKRGKSTFINALLGDEILPAYAKPCTAIINEVKWGEFPRALLHYEQSKDGSQLPPKPVSIKEIEQYVVIQDGLNEKEAIHSNPYEKIELFWPLVLCRNGVEIIDSPGLNENEIRQKITTDYLSRVDAILFVLSCEALASSSELNFIDNTLRSTGHEDIFFICNRFNMIRRKERESIKDYAFAKLAPRTQRGSDRVFFIDSLDALEGRLDGDEQRVASSGISQVEGELAKFLTTEKGRVKLLRPAMELRGGIREARRLIPEREALLRTDLNTLERRYAEAQEPLRQLEIQRQQIVTRIYNFLEDTKLSVKDQAISFYRELTDQKIPEWANNYTIQQPVEFFKLEFMTKQIERVVTEVTEYLSAQIEGELANWQRSQLQPLITRRLESLMTELDAKAQDFVRKLDDLRLQVSGTSVSTTDVESGKKVSAIERLLAAAGGYIIGGLGSAALGAVFGYEEMLKSILPQLAIGIATVVLVGFNPWVLIPAMMAGGMIQGMFKMKSTNEKIKKVVVQEYVNQIRQSSYQQSDEIANAVIAQLNEVKDTVDLGLGKEIQSVRDQVESVFTEKQKGQANVDQKLQQLQSIYQELNLVESQLDELINSLII
ncbi:Dynamin family protein [Coleofasciculus chthonoplastes PCC 7420]|uniref:Dynamin family protein n=1 Tax=Coleofasciculus chthonoplastes PCC 7420 TaxID=118168 RepID=B4VV94_9CYAN|nr:dynamin family protein [Coleofasciculus chthonoplastes]EDX74232.1 Dynamin family protein [Coleofasciculus chthonoplastes PCC 7420]